MWPLVDQPHISRWSHSLEHIGSSNWTWLVQRKRIQTWVDRGGLSEMEEGSKYDQMHRMTFLKNYQIIFLRAQTEQLSKFGPRQLQHIQWKKNSTQHYENSRKLRTASQRTSSLRLGPKVGLEFTVGKRCISDNASAVEGTEMTVIDTVRKLRSRMAVSPQADWLYSRQQHSGPCFCLVSQCYKELSFIGLQPIKSKSIYDLVNRGTG